MKKFFSTVIGLIINVGIVCFVIYLVPKVTTRAYQMAKDFILQPSDEERIAKEVSITIPSGSSTREIARILKENGLVTNSDLFTIKAMINEYDGTFKMGDYSLNTSMSEDEIMEILKQGTKAQADIIFTIPEGYTTLKIAKKLEAENIIKAEEFLKAVEEGHYDYDFLSQIPTHPSRLEGYLFPDTYFFRNGVTGEEIVSKLLSRFKNIYRTEYSIAASEKGYTMDEVITMASIVEKESKVPIERPVIAGVMYNRLNLSMPLQMDSTVNYAFELKDGVDSGRDEKQVLLEDLKIDSAYNTYENAGLPIGPICNPGLDAIEAVLFPEHHEYVYFVLKDATTGEHEFTRTHEEHVAAKAKYRQ